MPRVDIWDIQEAKEEPAVDCGYPRVFDQLYEAEYVIGKGGFGTVRCVKEKATGLEYACKSVNKKLDVPNLSVEKQARHIDNVKREIAILRKLRGTLSVVHFKAAYEDDDAIHMVMEYCRGGELHHRVGKREYNERTVQRVMKCCLQTLAQCHSHHILHRDIKPGNFMFLSDEEDSPVKALDFGLAVFYDPAKLPRTDLGLEGTPWFMAPEALSSEVWPVSDVWAAGVMAYQLLCGYMPFDDRRNPNSPALSVIWKAILTDEPKLSGSSWSDISEDAVDFVRSLLVKDPAKRPSAKEALSHRWLRAEEASLPAKPISHQVVQRIQRYCQGNLVKRTILELIAGELLEMLRATSPDPSVHGGNRSAHGGAALAAMALLHKRAGSGGGSLRGSADALSAIGESSPSGAAAAGGGEHAVDAGQDGTAGGGGLAANDSSGGLHAMDLDRMDDNQFRDAIGHRLQRRINSVHGGTEFYKVLKESKSMGNLMQPQYPKAYTTHGGKNYWRMMRAAATLMTAGNGAGGSVRGGVGGSGHDGGGYLRVVGRTPEEKEAQAKARRLALDTSEHGTDGYRRLLHSLEAAEQQAAKKARPDAALSAASPHVPPPSSVFSMPQFPTKKHDRAGRRSIDRSTEKHVGFSLPPVSSPEGSKRGARAERSEGSEEGGRGQGAFKAFMEAQGVEVKPPSQKPPSHPPLPPSAARHAAAATTFASSDHAGAGPGSKPVAGDGASAQHQQQRQRGEDGGSGSGVSTIGEAAAAAAAATGSGSGGGSGGDIGLPLPQGQGGSLASASSQEKIGQVINPKQLREVMAELSFSKQQNYITKDELSEGLHRLGYDLASSELEALMDQLDLDQDGRINKQEFVASQMDWGALQEGYRDMWLQCVRRAFAALDVNQDGRLCSAELVGLLRDKLPASEVEWALEDALVEAGYAEAEDMDFEAFLRMVNVASHDSLDSLDQYESRMAGVQPQEPHFQPELEPLPEEDK